MRNSTKLVRAGRVVVFAIVLPMVLSGGCGRRKPDVEQLRLDLENRLEENRSSTSMGNADIYKLISLEKTGEVSKEKDLYTIEYKGQVECLKGFYMGDGKYSLSKPEWKAKMHVTQGQIIGFVGQMTYERGVRGWKVRENVTDMSIRDAPRL